jgi:hypothetical protein
MTSLLSSPNIQPISDGETKAPSLPPAPLVWSGDLSLLSFDTLPKEDGQDVQKSSKDEGKTYAASTMATTTRPSEPAPLTTLAADPSSLTAQASTTASPSATATTSGTTIEATATDPVPSSGASAPPLPEVTRECPSCHAPLHSAKAFDYHKLHAPGTCEKYRRRCNGTNTESARLTMVTSLLVSMTKDLENERTRRNATDTKVETRLEQMMTSIQKIQSDHGRFLTMLTTPLPPPLPPHVSQPSSGSGSASVLGSVMAPDPPTSTDPSGNGVPTGTTLSKRKRKRLPHASSPSSSSPSPSSTPSPRTIERLDRFTLPASFGAHTRIHPGDWVRTSRENGGDRCGIVRHVEPSEASFVSLMEIEVQWVYRATDLLPFFRSPESASRYLRHLHFRTEHDLAIRFEPWERIPVHSIVDIFPAHSLSMVGWWHLEVVVRPQLRRLVKKELEMHLAILPGLGIAPLPPLPPFPPLPHVPPLAPVPLPPLGIVSATGSVTTDLANPPPSRP